MERDENILSFEAAKHDPDWVRCARCKKRIRATETQCPKCGVHFQGEAYDFDPDYNGGLGRKGLITTVIVVILAVAMLFWFFATR